MSKKLKYILWIAMFLLLLIPIKAEGKELINIHYFWGSGCPACASMSPKIDNLEEKYPEVKVYKYEIYNNRENYETLFNVQELLDVKIDGIPCTIIGNKVVIGAYDHQVESYIKYYLENPYKDEVGEMLGIVEYDDNYDIDNSDNSGSLDSINIPLIGSVDLKNLSLPLITIIFGLLDGFNPCALWVLLFLISILIGMKDRKRMWFLGTAFIIASALIYFLFMSAILQVMIVIGARMWFRILLAIAAFLGGVINLKNYLDIKEAGCKVASSEQRNKTFEKIRKFTKERSLIIAVIGIIIIAASVNLFELACSAGLPAAYIKILEMNETTTVGHYSYLLLYLFFFMLDHIVIFTISMLTFKLTGVSNKYFRYSKLAGGILMFIIGILLAVKPEWLMFG